MNKQASLDESYALVIGISHYIHIPQLPPAVRHGARQIAEVLADPHLGGYPPDQVRLLVDGEATRMAVLEELAVLSSLAGPSSTAVIYFAGHGGRDATGGTYLLPVEAADTESATLVNSAISGAELSAAIAAIPASRVLVIFDCCHAGGLGNAGPPQSLSSGLPESYCQVLGASRGRVVLAAARSAELSWLPDTDSCSFFTHHLLAALRGGAAGRDGWIRAWDLFEYIQPRVTMDRHDQHPVLRGELEENFPVALALGGQGATFADTTDSYLYDVYVSYADREPDADWVWRILVPRLEAVGLTVAVSGDIEEPGVFRVVGAERGIIRARRTVVVLSEAYLGDEMTSFVDALAQTVGLEEGQTRLLPVFFDSFDVSRLPARLRMLVKLDLKHPYRGPRNFNRLVKTLQTPPPAALAID